MNPLMAQKVTRFVATHDANVRAAVHVAVNSALKYKIDPYIDEDGWIEWRDLAAALTAGLPWSSGEKRLARLACSLSGEMPAHLDSHGQVYAWSLVDMLSGLDGGNTITAVEAITLAATGRTGGAR